MDGFNSLDALYKRLLPALKSKKKEFVRLGITSISEKDIWNYLSTTRWIKSVNLTLADMVNDIMIINENDLAKYITEKVEVGK